MSSMPGLSWGALILRGVLLVALGVAAILLPGPALAALIAVFGAFALVDGVLAIVHGFMARGGPRWFLVLAGIAGVAIGVITFFSPGSTAIAVVLLVGAWSIVQGIGQVVTAWQMRKAIEGEGWWILSGAVSVLFGAYLVIFPGAGALAVLWLIGFYAIFFGVMLVYLGWLARQHQLAMQPA
jgi:uncharacterized membrane protein HdeD (DUF308 family)